MKFFKDNLCPVSSALCLRVARRSWSMAWGTPPHHGAAPPGLLWSCVVTYSPGTSPESLRWGRMRAGRRHHMKTKLAVQEPSSSVCLIFVRTLVVSFVSCVAGFCYSPRASGCITGVRQRPATAAVKKTMVKRNRQSGDHNPAGCCCFRQYTK